MEDLIKLITVENFAMVVALYLLVKTTSSIEKLTTKIGETCTLVTKFADSTYKIIETWEKRMWVYDMHLGAGKKKKEEEEKEEVGCIG